MATTSGSKRLLDISANGMAASNSMTYGGLNVATEQYVSTQVSNLVASAPGTLDTLNELAAALGDDPNFATTITNSIATKLDASVNPIKAASVSNDTITFTRADNTTFSITTSDANTDTNYYLNGITRSGNTLTFSVNGATNQSYTFGSAAWSATTAFDAAGAADGVNDRIDNEIIPLINGKADASHTHSYLPLSGGTITGALTVSGSTTRGTYTSVSQYHSGADNIVLKGNASGISSIFFESEKDGTNINHPSDFGFIQYHPYGTGTTGESNELIIGVSNDADDHLVLNAPNVNGLKFRTGASATDYTVYHSGNLSLATLGYTGATNANYITNNNQLTNGAGYITGVAWNDITSKPSTFAPSAHTHAISEVDGLQTELDGKLNTSYNGSYGTNWYVNALYYDDWLRNHTNNNGIYWSNTGWHLYPESNMYFRLRSGNSAASAIRFNTAGTDRNFIYNSSSNEIGFLNTSGSWIFRVDNSGVLQTGNIPWARLSSVPSTFSPSAHTHAISEVDGLQAELDGKQAAGSYAASNHNHTYDVNNAWLRDNGDSANVKLYGNSRQMVFRTDGTTEYASGVGGYAFAWMYGGDASNNRRMLLGSDGRLWTNYHGWLDTAFASASHNHDSSYDAAGSSAAVNDRIDSEVIPLIDTKQDAGTYNTVIGTDSDINTGGYDIIDNLYMTDGVITSHGTRQIQNLRIPDTRTAEKTPDDYQDYGVSSDFTDEFGSLGAWYSGITLKGWHDGYAAWQLIGGSNTSVNQSWYLRSGVGATWSTMNRIWHSGDFSSTDVTNWNSAYNNYITGIAVTGTTTKTITLTQRDGGTISDTFSDLSGAGGDGNDFLINGTWDEGSETLSLEVANQGQVDIVLTNTMRDTDTNTWRGIHDTPVNGATTTSISSNWAFDNVKTAVPAGAVFTDTQYSVGDGGLTQKNFTTTLKTKLDGIAAGADVTPSWVPGTDPGYLTSIPAHTHGIAEVDGLDTALNDKADANHNHDSRYYTESEVDTLLSGKANSSHTHSYLPLSGGTLTGDLTVSGNQVITTGSNADVKFSVWSGTTYGIGMTSGVTYGGLNDYAMTFCMNNDSDRGFWWGYSGQSKSAGAMSLTTGGILTVASSITAGGDITAFSDIRVKENIKDLENSLDKVTQLRGVSYNKIGSEEKSIGVIAQEIQEVLPEVVREGQDGMLSVAYGNITAVLIEAIKEQQEIISQLEERIVDLENRM